MIEEAEARREWQDSIKHGEGQGSREVESAGRESMHTARSTVNGQRSNSER